MALQVSITLQNLSLISVTIWAVFKERNLLSDWKMSIIHIICLKYRTNGKVQVHKVELCKTYSCICTVFKKSQKQLITMHRSFKGNVCNVRELVCWLFSIKYELFPSQWTMLLNRFFTSLLAQTFLLALGNLQQNSKFMNPNANTRP